MHNSSDTHESLWQARVRVPDHVVYRSFEAETVLLNLRTGAYHGLNPSGARMFELLRDLGSVELAIREAASEFDQPLDVIRPDVTDLCSDLAARDLIEIDGASN
jgi:hypothetical protein